ncbi:MAG: hypothetical protein V4710_05665, partial [Verrucomicrobiota bacterium]
MLDRVLLQAPALIEAHTCKADTLVRLERIDEAWKLAGGILEIPWSELNATPHRCETARRRDSDLSACCVR